MLLSPDPACRAFRAGNLPGRLLAAFVIATWLGSGDARALTVNTLVDEQDGSVTDGDVSLRDALALAPAGDVITFGVTGTIKLTRGQLLVDKSLTIQGPGRNQLTIDAAGGDPTPQTNNGDGIRALYVNQLQQRIQVVIRGIRITGGDVNGTGGGVLTRVETVIDDCEVTDCYASEDGGGICAQNPKLTISSTAIFNNSSRGAGGIYIGGTGSCLLSDLFVRGNTGNVGGVAFRSYHAPLRVVRGAFAENVSNPAANSRTAGGAIDCVGPLDLQDTLFYTNTARGDGGAISLVATEQVAQGTAASGPSRIVGAYFSGNKASGSGGAVAAIDYITYLRGAEGYPLSKNAPVELSGCTFDQNSSAYGGGAVFVSAPQASLTRCTLKRNSNDRRGGGLYVSKASLVTVKGSELRENYAPSGGAAYSSGELTVAYGEGSTKFIDNRAGEYGSAITSVGKLTVYGGLFSNRGANQSVAGAGGALYVTGRALISDSGFYSNRGRIGGAIATSGRAADVTVEYASFHTNIGDYRGGAIDVDFGSVVRLRQVSASGNVSPRGPDVYNAGQLYHNDDPNDPNRLNIAGPGEVLPIADSR